MIYALGVTGIGWWHLLCPRDLITLSAYVAIVIMAFTFGAVGIGRWTNKRIQSV